MFTLGGNGKIMFTLSKNGEEHSYKFLFLRRNPLNYVIIRENKGTGGWVDNLDVLFPTVYSLDITSGGEFGSSTRDGPQANGDARPPEEGQWRIYRGVRYPRNGESKRAKLHFHWVFGKRLNYKNP